ncbi:MAG: superoxide dismutase family protein [Deltaproteobacteria bacterium]|nr:superoxide dismutase family protein [Deltaproteobacteria bacterium]
MPNQIISLKNVKATSPVKGLNTGLPECQTKIEKKLNRTVVNPKHKQHGMQNSKGWHAGDIVNLEVKENGKAEGILIDDDVTLGPGPNSLFHPGGTSLVIHADRDDYTTDPSGNSGTRIACGLVEPD